MQWLEEARREDWKPTRHIKLVTKCKPDWCKRMPNGHLMFVWGDFMIEVRQSGRVLAYFRGTCWGLPEEADAARKAFREYWWQPRFDGEQIQYRRRNKAKSA